MAATAVLFVDAVLQEILMRRIVDEARKYDVIRVSNLTAAAFIIAACLTILFTDWYGALVSFGVISLIPVLPCKTPLPAFSVGFTFLFENPMKSVTGGKLVKPQKTLLC